MGVAPVNVAEVAISVEVNAPCCADAKAIPPMSFLSAAAAISADCKALKSLVATTAAAGAETKAAIAAEESTPCAADILASSEI